MSTVRLLIALLVVVGIGGAFWWQQGRSSRDDAARQAAPAQTPTAPAPRTAETAPAAPPQAQAPAGGAPASPAPASPAPAAPTPAPAPAPAQSAQPASPASPGPADAALADAPAFDVVRIEPSGDAVIAGRAAPSATVELLRSGAVHDRVVADTGGLFAMTPPPLPPGTHELGLRFTTPDGRRIEARQSVTVVIAEDRRTAPVVALTAPGAPTVVLSTPTPTPAPAQTAQSQSAPSQTSQSQAPQSPTPPAPAAPSQPAPAATPAPAPAPAPAPRPSVAIVTVESEEGGRLYVSGKAAPGATIRLYLNDSYLASAAAGADGAVSFAIQGGVRAGDYRVRLDDTDVASGQVRSRAEVAYAVPAPAAPAQVAAAPAPATTAPAVPAAGSPAAATPAAGAGASAPAAGTPPPVLQAGAPVAPPTLDAGRGPGTSVPAATLPATVLVPEVKTTIVSRGDSLWRISKRVYGQGTRYTVIYDANDQQIRNPNLIYPGQVFVLPGEGG